jgi:hypothetical protein
MLLKIFIVGAIAIGFMAAIKDGRVLRDAGLLGHCNAVAVGGRAETNEMSCSKGRLDGFPDLTNKSCKLVSASSAHETWHCAAPVVSSQSPTG